ncbi:MAG: hypothetical protein ACRC33_11105, partial [Gemmataceae bacterium]
LIDLGPGKYAVKLVPASDEVARPAGRVEVADNETDRLDFGAVLRNFAPTLSGDGPTLRYLEDAVPATGVSVEEVLGTTFADANAVVRKGIAVVGLDGPANGRWQFSLDGGGTWADLGPVARSSARLLRAADRVRFVPARDFNGTVGLQYHAWDQTAGTAGQLAPLGVRLGGETAFSDRAARLVCAVAAVNDAPVVTGLPATPAGSGVLTVRELLAGRVADPDRTPLGLAVVAAEGIGRWQFSRDGRTWSDVGPVSPKKSRLLGPNDLVRFVPSPGWAGKAALTFRGWDQSLGLAGQMADTTVVGGTSPFSLGKAVATATVKRVG